MKRLSKCPIADFDSSLYERAICSIFKQMTLWRCSNSTSGLAWQRNCRPSSWPAWQAGVHWRLELSRVGADRSDCYWWWSSGKRGNNARHGNTGQQLKVSHVQNRSQEQVFVHLPQKRTWRYRTWGFKIHVLRNFKFLDTKICLVLD